MKGIILAGGRGSRLYPMTLATCKQLLPIYDKPLIYYPLSTLMWAGIRDILIISTKEDLPRFETLLGDGSQLGLRFSYALQERPEGIAQALLIGAPFLAKESVALVLGDNIFYGDALPKLLSTCSQLEQGAIILGYEVIDPNRYGVIAFDEKQNVQAIIEKPKIPPSRYAVTGLYFYDADAAAMASTLRPSLRGELEITDLNQLYLERGDLHLRLLDKGFTWLDTGTHAAFQRASSFVQEIQEREGINIACIEEIAYRLGYINRAELLALSRSLQASDYGRYLHKIAGKPAESHVEVEESVRVEENVRGRWDM